MREKASFRFKDNAIKGGGVALLKVEGIKDEDEVLDKECVVTLYEIDRRSTKKLDKLAWFKTKIKKDPHNDFQYIFAEFSREDTNNSDLPGPETVKVKDNDTNQEWEIDYKPHWKPAHFIFGFSEGEESPNQEFDILIYPNAEEDDFKDRGERENYVYEIGIIVKINGAELFNDTKKRAVMTVDCNNLLAENCATATKLYLNKHNDALSKRMIGIGWGVEHLYPPSNDTIRQFDLLPWGCLNYAYRAIRLGHQKTNAFKEWSSINKIYVDNDSIGNSLAKGLEKLGWTGLFYNRDITDNDRGGYYITQWNYVQNTAKYPSRSAKLKLKISDLIINYQTANPDLSQTTKLKRVPFGLVNAYSHNGLIIDGKIYEVHWKAGHFNTDNNGDPLLLFDNGKDFETDWKWVAGMIHVPKGCWS